ncbi:TPA: hypothetical protein DCQ44_02570 [Candidatus Taylorbacteria bacterium]|nr:hypothetical protein [Candidatus Taylorbacteria bacterium]
MKKNLLIVLCSLLLVGVSFWAGFTGKVKKSEAQVEEPLGAIGLSYGGYLAAYVPCTCSGTVDLYYFPASPLDYFPAGVLTYVPEFSKNLLYFDPLILKTWHMGKFIPSVPEEDGACWMWIGPACIPMVGEDGIITEVGSALVPAPPM